MATAKKPTIKVSKKKTKAAKDKAKKKEFFGLLDLPDELADRGRDIWLAGLGALSMVEEEGVKLFNNLVEKGEAWEKESRKQLGVARKKLDEARGKVGTVVDDAASKGSKITELDDMILSTVEDTVEKVLQRLGVPTRAEVKDLAGKVENLAGEVSTLVEAIENKKGTKAPVKATSGNGKVVVKSTAKKIVYHVVPHAEGWAVKEEGVVEPLLLHGTKEEALTAARGLAKAHTPSRLVTHKKDGRVQESVTYQE